MRKQFSLSLQLESSLGQKDHTLINLVLPSHLP